MNDFRIDIMKGKDGLILKVAADCRSVEDVTELIAALRAARHALGRPAVGAAQSRGGLNRAIALSPARRSEIASKAAKTRWKK